LSAACVAIIGTSNLAIAKKAGTHLTPREVAIMNVLWDQGPSTVQEVRAQLDGKRAYTTVQTILNILVKKRRTHRTPQGKAYVYRPILSRELAMQSAIRDLVERMCGDSVETLMMNLLKTEKVNDDTLRRLRRAMTERGEGL
jgi:predicted transcriptional regulator